MLITRETDLQDLETWQGATVTKDKIIEEGKEREFEQLIDELYPDGISEIDLNDLLWFGDEFIYNELGIEIEE